MNKRNFGSLNVIIIMAAYILFATGIFCLTNRFQELISLHYARSKVFETYPYMFWNSSWQALAQNILNSTVPTQESLNDLATFFNRYAAFAWLLIYVPIIWFTHICAERPLPSGRGWKAPVSKYNEHISLTSL